MRTKFLAFCLLSCVPAAAAQYDPLGKAVAGGARAAEAQTMDLSVEDGARERVIPLKVYLPPARDPSPVVLFSHGLGGTREGCVYLAEHWAARGYVAVLLQHPGSDDSVWRNEPLAKRMAAMNRAASAQNFMLRVQDVAAVLDRLEAWNEQAGHALSGRLDLSRVGMSGHSFGAITTQALSGQSFFGGPRLTDERIRAAIAFSPSSPPAGDAGRAFGRVTIPWLLMTGTKDTAPIGGQTVESRLAVFPALPAGNKYELVLDKAEHSVFTDRALPGDSEKRNPNHHRAILAVSTAFWDAFLRGDEAAKAWLDGPGPRAILEDGDRWQRK
ncbi:MAG TPA: dienelactone hydrolase [Thermoguttaceae bacterium]|nr:dienelactone hydrolase [Thermoguttaceae bacterium]